MKNSAFFSIIQKCAKAKMQYEKLRAEAISEYVARYGHTPEEVEDLVFESALTDVDASISLEEIESNAKMFAKEW